MKISRRKFIKAGTFAAAFAGTAVIAPVSLAARNKTIADGLALTETLGDSLFNKTAEDFRKYIGAEFMLLSGGETVSVRLSQVTDAPKSGVESNGYSSRFARVESRAKFRFVVSKADRRIFAGDILTLAFRFWRIRFII